MRTKPIVVATAAVLVAGTLGVVMMRNHRDVAPLAPTKASVLETAPQIADAEAMKAITAAGIAIDHLSVRSAGGIYVVRGSGDSVAANRAVDVLKSLGVSRVANLVSPARASDDEKIRRDAERELASRPALAGTKLVVTCDAGVVTVSGTVQHELQKDLA
ncbi:MAG: BON domain-containing protein, partial [Acidobacteriota bacterium]